MFFGVCLGDKLIILAIQTNFFKIKQFTDNISSFLNLFNKYVSYSQNKVIYYTYKRFVLFIKLDKQFKIEGVRIDDEYV